MTWFLKKPWEISPDLVLSKDERVVKEQVANLNMMLTDIYRYLGNIKVAGGVPSVDIMDYPFVLHGDTVPDDLTDGALHRDMTGADLHWPKYHAARHMNNIDPLPLMPPPFIFPGVPQTGRNIYGFPILRTTTVQKLALNLEKAGAGDVIIRLLVNGGAVVPTDRVATITAGARYQLTDIADLVLTVGQVLGCFIVQGNDFADTLSVYAVV